MKKVKGAAASSLPGGDVIAAAPANEETILTASVSLESVLQSKSVIDVGAHYSRPDVLQLHVDRRPFEPIVDRTRSDSSEPPIVVSGANTSFDTLQSAGGNEQQEETKETEGP